MDLTLDNLNDINKYLKKDTKEWILDKIKKEKKSEKIFKDVEELHKVLLNNDKCSNISRSGGYYYGDFRYKYNNKIVRIEVINVNSVEVKIDNYCYATDSVEDVIKVLPDIHIAMDKGII